MTNKLMENHAVGELGIQQFVDVLPFCVILVNAQHRILLVNRAAQEHLGGEREHVIGGYCPSVFHGCDGAFPGCPLEEAVETGRAVERELFDARTGLWMKSAVYPTSFLCSDGQEIFVHTAQDISEGKLAKEELERNFAIQTALSALLRVSMMNLSLEAMLERILEEMTSLPWLAVEDKGSIHLAEGDPEILVLKVHRNLAEPLIKTCSRVPFGRCLCGRAALSGDVEFAECIDDRHENTYDRMLPHGHYCVPIRGDGKTLGVLNLYLRAGHKRDDSEVEFLKAAANVAAGIVGLKRAEDEVRRGLHSLQKAMDGTIELVASMVERRDPYTAGHQRRVATLAVAIAEEMGFSEDKVKGLYMAGLVHDVGKIAIPAEILTKPSKLSDVEFSLMKAHPQVGFDMLKTIEFPWPVATIVLQHHERMDGSGYPSGLSSRDILIEARILQVADVVEAIASHRPYRPALGIDAALEEISSKSGIYYDPEVAEACARLIREKEFTFETYRARHSPLASELAKS